MQQMREMQQPFFKPLSFSEQNVNNNRYEQTPQAHPVQVRPKFQQNSAQFQINKGRENEQSVIQQQEQSQGNERISSLHVKLQQEADRIRKWKVQTEIEIKQKDKKIKEATHTIESLRKSILELQLQNESLSLRLQEEISSREEILHRINATREMCNLLKDHSAATEERLQKCETERTELKYIEKQHVKQFEELSQKFDGLDITSKKEKEELTEKLTAELNKREELQKELKNHKEEMKTTLNELMKESDEKDIEIRDVRAELCKNEEEIHKMNSIIDGLQSEIGGLRAELEQKQNCITESGGRLNKIMEDYGKLEEKLTETSKSLEESQNSKLLLSEEFETNKNTFAEEVNTLKCHLGTLTSTLDKERSRVMELETTLQTMEHLVNDLKSAKDILMMEKSEVETKAQEFFKEKTLLSQEKEKLVMEKESLAAEIGELSSELAKYKGENFDYKTELQSVHNNMEMLMEEKKKIKEELDGLKHEVLAREAKFQDMKKSYAEKVNLCTMQTEELENISKMMEGERQINETLHLKVKEDEQVMMSLNTEIDKYKAEINQLQKDIKALSKKEGILQNQIEKLTEAENEYEKKLENIQNELEIALEENEALKSEKAEQDKNFNGELQTMSKETGKLEQKMKSLKEDLSAKNKHSKELEKEIRSLKSKVTSQTKAIESRDKEIEELQEEKESSLTDLQELQAVCEELKAGMETEKNLSEEAKKEVQDLKKQFDEMLKEKESMEKKCEHEIQELMSTMEKYHQSNAKLVEDKNKEIEKLKKDISKNKDLSKSQNDANTLELQREIDQMQSLLNDSNENLKSLQQENEELNSKMKKFEDGINEKDIKISQLQSEVDQMLRKMKSCEEDTNNVERENKEYKEKMRRFENDLNDKECEIQELMAKISNLKVEKRESNTSLKLKQKGSKNQNMKENLPTTPNVSSLSQRDEGLKEVNTNIRMTPKVPTNLCTTPKYTPTQSKPKMNRPSPNASKAATPALLTLKTPQRSILKAENGNSIIKKRRVVFASDDENGSESSSSEMMEVELNEIESRIKSTTPKRTPLLLKPSPRVKTPDRTMCSDSEDENEDVVTRNPKQLHLNRVPRAPAAIPQTKRETDAKMQKTIDEKDKMPSSDKSQNIRKAPSKPQGKFFLTSPKERLKNQKKNSKLSKLKRTEDSWFEMDSIFGFED
ncbi:uncharacterized protein LOC144624005 [Crassostrea virginica]